MPAPKHNVNTANCSVNSALADSFVSSLHALGPFEPRPHLAVALSGGADSTALLLLARAWAQSHGRKITALIVDHRLRDDSTQEARHVATEHDAIILTPEHHDSSNNLLEQAREWRYDALTTWCRNHDVLHLLVAHHADDQAETIALHTTRGQTEDGASGMAAVTIRDGVRIVRPLLNVRKLELIHYLQAQDVCWVEDPTNANLNFKRNALRAEMTEIQTEALNAVAQREGQARAERDATFARAAVEIAQANDTHITLDLVKLLALPSPIATRLLADSLCVVSASHTRPRKHETEGLFSRVQETAFSRSTLKHCLVEKRGNHLHITLEPSKTKAERQPKALAASPFWWLNPRLI
jgi:tRNA(Ile)-lysidine synthase